MKGSLHTDELLGAVVARETGLRTGRRISHVFIMDVPTYHKVLIVTDAAINIAPTLEDKVDICQNAIDLARVARRRAAEGRDPRGGRDGQLEDAGDASTPPRCARWPSAARSRAALLDGPLAFDNAISKEAAQIKGITSEVAGDPDILLAPDLEAGNILAKQLSFLANADSAGLVLGARVPIILTSRADSVRSRIASCAVAMLAAHARRRRRKRRDRSRHGRLRSRPERRLVEPEVLRLPAARRRDAWRLEARGQIEGIGTSPRFTAKDGAGATLADETLDAAVRDGARRARRAGRLAARAATAARACSASATASSTAAPRFAGADRRDAARCSTSCGR